MPARQHCRMDVMRPGAPHGLGVRELRLVLACDQQDRALDASADSTIGGVVVLVEPEAAR